MADILSRPQCVNMDTLLHKSDMTLEIQAVVMHQSDRVTSVGHVTVILCEHDISMQLCFHSWKSLAFSDKTSPIFSLKKQTYNALINNVHPSDAYLNLDKSLTLQICPERYGSQQGDVLLYDVV